MGMMFTPELTLFGIGCAVIIAGLLWGLVGVVGAS